MPEPDRILRIRTVLGRIGLSRSTLYRKMKDETFPKQVKLGEHSSGWRESTINAWVADPEAFGRSGIFSPEQFASDKAGCDSQRASTATAFGSFVALRVATEEDS